MTLPPSYGDVTSEYLALRRDAAVVDHTHELVWVRGPDAVSFLDGLLSQEIAGQPSGRACRSLLLSPQGKLRATLWLLCGDDEIGVVSDRGVGSVVAEELRRFKIRVDVTIDSEPTPLASIIGPRAATAIETLGLPSVDASAWTAGGDAIVVGAPFVRSGPARYLVDAGSAAALVDRGVAQAGALAAASVRIETGEPVMGVDMDEGTIPAEAAVVDGAVSFTKGCYLGQELVARIDSRGRVNRHLRGLTISSNVLPPVGAELVADGAVVGTLTSIGESLDLRRPVGLALIRREVEPGDGVAVRWQGGETEATVQELPLIP
jgi:aminomethyltransferase